MTPVKHLELRISPGIFEKIRNGPNGPSGIFRGLGDTDFWKKPEVENRVVLSLYFPLSRVSFKSQTFLDCLLMYVFTLLLGCTRKECWKNFQLQNLDETLEEGKKCWKNAILCRIFRYSQTHACIAYILFSANTVISSVQNFYFHFLFVLVEFLGDTFRL